MQSNLPLLFQTFRIRVKELIPLLCETLGVIHLIAKEAFLVWPTQLETEATHFWQVLFSIIPDPVIRLACHPLMGSMIHLRNLLKPGDVLPFKSIVNLIHFTKP